MILCCSIQKIEAYFTKYVTEETSSKATANKTGVQSLEKKESLNPYAKKKQKKTRSKKKKRDSFTLRNSRVLGTERDQDGRIGFRFEGTKVYFFSPSLYYSNQPNKHNIRDERAIWRKEGILYYIFSSFLIGFLVFGNYKY